MKRQTAALALCTVFVSGCGSSTKTHYYTLETTPPVVVAAEIKRAQPIGIAIASLTLPELVDRQQLVLRIGDTQVLINDQHHWGQPLKSEITRSLAASLARETGAQVTVPGQAHADDSEIKLVIDFLRFDSVLGGDATIEANWNVLRKGVKQAVGGHAVVREASNGAGYDALVAAHRRALERLGSDIAATLKP